MQKQEERVIKGFYVLFSYEKERNPAINNSMNGLWSIMLSEVNQTEIDNYCMISFTWGF